MSFSEVQLGDLIRIKHGFAFKSEFFREQGKYVILTPGHFFETGGFRDRPDKDRFYAGDFPEGYILRKHSLVIAMTEQGAGLLGSSALVPEEDRYLHNQRIGLVTITDPDRIDDEYLYRLFNTRAVRAQIDASASGTKVRHTAPERVYRVKASIPSVDVQRKIASTVSQYDDLIENNRRRIALMEQAARLLYEEWFVRFHFPGHDLVRKREVQPEQWRRRFISEIVTTQYGYTDSASVEPIGPKFLRGTDINKTSYIDWDSVPYCLDRTLDFEQYALKPNDILVIRMADPGKVAIVEQEIRAVFASYLVRLQIRPDAEVRPLYLFYVMASPAYSGYISGSSEKSTRKSASAPLLTNFEIRIPPQELQQQFVDTVGTWRKQINLLLQQNGLLTKARDLLLPRLMNGEVEV